MLPKLTHMIGLIKQLLKRKPDPITEKPAEEAYDTWSGSYDQQPGNLMLDLDELIFEKFLQRVNIENKRLLDVGCGTGRHWKRLYEQKPASLTGYDVSSGMLEQLKHKFPSATVFHSTNNLLSEQSPYSVDCIISTLTVAHIEDIEEAVAAWAKVLVKEGDIIITDFHPGTLANGGRRSFKHDNKSFFVVNYVHPLESLKQIFYKYGFELLQHEERFIDERVRPYYLAQNAIPVYKRFKGMPVIYGLHLKKVYAAE